MIPKEHNSIKEHIGQTTAFFYVEREAIKYCEYMNESKFKFYEIKTLEIEQTPFYAVVKKREYW